VYYLNASTGNVVVEIIEKTSADTPAAVKTQYFYVDMETKTATKLSLDSYMSAYSEKSIRTRAPMGIRFKSCVLTSAKDEETSFVIDEYGFIVTTEGALAGNELTLSFPRIVTGVAYSKSRNIDLVFDSSVDEQHIFTGVLKNVPVENYKTDLVCKTYTKITVDGEQFTLYGETVKGNIYDTALKLLETDPDNADLIKIVLDADNSIGLDVGGLYE